VISGQGASWEGTPDFDPREGVVAVVEIRERVAPEIFESRLSVRPVHKTDMMDNHYKTSMLVK